ncbi:alpha-amylase [Flavobacteriaceae bacterium UJ101]|nr:alpha-amylase [Flavobacteriaceae bacterium UJ101]
MKRINLLTFSILLSIITTNCNDDTNEITTESTAIAPTKSSRTILNTGSKVMMQAFYWDVPAGGNWWNTVSQKIGDWEQAGIDAIWLPPASKAMNGATSMGYDPYDYFDLGKYDQKGSTETRFGSEDELRNLVANAHNHNIAVIADIVINHNSGADKQEDNIFTGTKTWTDFTEIASGKFTRTQYDFHPNDSHSNDTGVFGGFPDLCHHKSYVQDWLWRSDESVAKFYMNDIGFDGWRFDFVKGFEPWVVKEWLNHNGGFSVGELWDGNASTLESWANAANSTAFDFACYYAMDAAFDNNDLTKLNNDMLLKRNPFKAVTFVTNHDTDEIWNKMLAYAYILTHEGYPTIFYQDYEEWLDKERLNNLIWIHNNLAAGSTTNLWTDHDEYIAKRNGHAEKAGLIIYINNADYWQERWIQTNWNNTIIKDYTGHSNWQPTTQGNGWVKIQTPPKSYSVWSIK